MTASRITTYPPTVAPLGVRLGYLTLRFPGCSEPAGAGPYVWCLPAVGGRIPVEELLFYAMGPVAMVLVYACADERWLSRYNPRQWWGYEPSGMIGLTIAAWSRGDAIFPVEAAVVWLFAPLSSILNYEFAKALTHHPRATRVALFGISARVRGR